MASKGKKNSTVATVLQTLGVAQSTLEADTTAEDAVTPPIGALQSEKGAQIRYDEALILLKPKGQVAAPQPPTVNDVISFLMPVAQNTANRIRSNQALFTLNPELVQAQRIWVSSILSPNDLQTGHINIVCDAKDLTEQERTAIGDAITTYFNDELKYGVQLAEWLGEVMFETGSKAIVILPKDEWRSAVQSSSETLSFNARATDKVPVGYNWDLLLDSADCRGDLESMARDAISSIEAALPSSDSIPKGGFRLEDVVDHMKHYVKKIVGSKTTVAPVVSQDVTELSASVKRRMSVSKDDAKKYLMTLFGGDVANKDALIFEVNPTVREYDEPILLELPTASVVPVCVKGSTSKHLGYFVLVDENGDPIIPKEEDWNPVNSTTQALVRQTEQAAVNDSSLQWRVLGGKPSDSQKAAHVSAAFSIAIKQLLMGTMKKRGIASVDIGAYNAISNCILYNMLHDKKVKLIYIPEPMMVYFCLDNRPDGTGRALTEPIEYILALRSTLFVAFVMSAIQHCLKHTTVTIDVDPSSTQLEQILGMVREMFVAKRMLSFSNNPNAITRDLAKQHISIIPKRIKGMEGNLEVTSESTVGQLPMIDEDMPKMFTNMALSGLGLPHSLFNMLNEAEYSRSIATSNIHHANNVRQNQAKLVIPATKYVVNYSFASSTVRNLISKILSEESGVKPDAEDKAVPGNANVNTDQQKRISQRMISALLNLKVVFSAPNVSVGKSQFEDIKSFIDSIDELVAGLFSDDALAGSNPELQEVSKHLRGLAKASLTRQYLDHIGINVFDIPELDTLIKEQDTNLVSHIQMLLNYKKRMDAAAVVGDAASTSPSSQGSAFQQPQATQF